LSSQQMLQQLVPLNNLQSMHYAQSLMNLRKNLFHQIVLSAN
jgi:hypothetical protein